MDYTILAKDEVLEKIALVTGSKNLKTYIVGDRAEALDKVRNLINAGATVMTGASRTLEEIGFVDLLKSGNHPWKNLKDAIINETDPAKKSELRRQSVSADYFLGSVHAITEEGELVVGSASGSQIPSYAFTSPNVIWVVGAQKVVPNLDEGLKRLRDYVVPLEDLHMKELGNAGTSLSEIWIFNKSIMPRNLNLILVKEKLGF